MKQIAYSFVFEGFKKSCLENVIPVVNLSFVKGVTVCPESNIMICDLSKKGANFRIGDNSCLNVSFTTSDVNNSISITKDENEFIFEFDADVLVESINAGLFDSVFVQFDFKGLIANSDNKTTCEVSKEFYYNDLEKACCKKLKINSNKEICTNWSLLCIPDTYLLFNSFSNHISLK